MTGALIGGRSLAVSPGQREEMKAVVVEKYDSIDNILLKEVPCRRFRPARYVSEYRLRASASSMV